MQTLKEIRLEYSLFYYTILLGYLSRGFEKISNGNFASVKIAEDIIYITFIVL